MAKDDALMTMGHYMHQDVAYGAKSPADFARNIIALMPTAERLELRNYLMDALERYSPSELKGKMNRATKSWGFSSKAAAEFLREVCSQLEAAVRSGGHVIC